MARKSKLLVPIEQIDGMIHTIRGIRVMLDRDLAQIYGVPTFRFNEAIKRNRHRFPLDFMFRLTRNEFDVLISQNEMSKPGRGGRRTLPYAFTEHGALQAANVLRSQRAVQMSSAKEDFSASHIAATFASLRALMPTEADTCRRFVVPKFQAAGWDNEPYSIAEQRTITDGPMFPVGKGFIRRSSKRVDYLLRYRRDFPLAVVEAKPEYKTAADGFSAG